MPSAYLWPLVVSDLSDGNRKQKQFVLFHRPPKIVFHHDVLIPGMLQFGHLVESFPSGVPGK